jgi:hypothetical protein
VGGGVAEPDVDAVVAEDGPAGGGGPERGDGLGVRAVEDDGGDRGEVTKS